MFFLWKNRVGPSINEITDKIYISNDVAAYTKKILEERKITHILVCGTYLEQKFPEDFKYHQLPLIDLPTQKLIIYFQEAFDFIEQGERVLVHCAAGISRSSSIVIAYLMAKNKWSYEIAYACVKKRRAIICPNSGFVAQLKGLEKSIQKGEFEIKVKTEIKEIGYKPPENASVKEASDTLAVKSALG